MGGGGRGGRLLPGMLLLRATQLFYQVYRGNCCLNRSMFPRKISLGEENVNIVQRGWTGGGGVEGAGSFQECYS